MKFSSRYNLLLSLSLSSLAAACFVACSDSAESDDTAADTDGGVKKDGSTTVVGDDSASDDDIDGSTVTDDGSTVTDDGSTSTTDGSTTLTDGSTTLTDGSSVVDGSTVVDGSVVVDSGIDAAKPKHLVKGSVSGLIGTGLVIQNNGADDIALTAVDAGSAAFTFATQVSEGATFAVTVKTQPGSPSQTCTVMGNGTMSTSDAVVSIACSTNAYKIKGKVKGLYGSGLKLTNNGGDELAITANAGAEVPFEFLTSVASGATFNVIPSAQPSGPTQTCVATNNNATVGGSDVVDVELNCTTNTYAISGTVTGLTGTGLKLQNNGGDEQTVNADGTFNFPTKVASGATYTVTVSGSPGAPIQTCTVSTNPTATVGAADISNVGVTCAKHYPTTGLVGYWNFEQVSPTVTDLSGNGNTATVRGAATQATAKIGKGYNLSGAGQCITVPSNASLAFGAAKAITFMMWTKVTNIATNQIFFNKENTWESGISQSGSSGTFEYAINANWAWYGTKTLTAGTWQHIATTWDGTTVTQYINGSGSFTQAQGGAMTANTTGFGMGCRSVAADGTIGGSSFLNGSIDEAFVYSRSLTAQEVLDYYNATK